LTDAQHPNRQHLKKIFSNNEIIPLRQRTEKIGQSVTTAYIVLSTKAIQSTSENHVSGIQIVNFRLKRPFDNQVFVLTKISDLRNFQKKSENF
jgi:hypothetical protein